jgi:hypothetical protein
MSKFRKTIPVTDIKKKANYFLKHSGSDMKADRLAVCNFLDTLLLEWNYRGFSYLNEEEVPEGCEPGCAKDANGDWIFPDESRRVYL